METKQLKATLEAASPSGTFTGYASVFGITDLQGDSVMRGAFAASLQEQGGRVVLLSQHDPAEAIGAAVLAEDQKGLRIVKGELLLDLQAARDAYVRLKAGILSGVSIGFQTVRDKMVGSVRQLLEVDLWEISLVTFPALPAARVDSVKQRRAEVGGMSAELSRLARSLSATSQEIRAEADEREAAAMVRQLSDSIKETSLLTRVRVMRDVLSGLDAKLKRS